MAKKKMSGIVVKVLDRTVSVKVQRLFTHPLYKKIIKRTSKYLVHDFDNKSSLGERVSFVESKPISKRKKWILLNN